MRAIQRVMRQTGMTEVQILYSIFQSEHGTVDWDFLPFLIRYRNTGALSKHQRQLLADFLRQ